MGGLAAYAWAGDSTPAAEQAQSETTAAGDQAPSTKQMQDHLLTTPKAFAAGEAEATSPAPAETSPAPAQAAEADVEPSAPAARGSAAPKTSKKSSNPQASKPKLERLDSLGADITSALK